MKAARRLQNLLLALSQDPDFKWLLWWCLRERRTRHRAGSAEVFVSPATAMLDCRSVLWKVGLLSGWRYSDRPDHAATIVWSDNTVVPPGHVPQSNDRPALNGGTVDISKSRVQEVFSDVFGYPLAVDPRAHEGPAVRKSEENAAHDGAVVQCPVEHPDPAHVYERVINNAVPGGLICDLRVVVIGDSIPFLYVKFRPESSRFLIDNTFVVMAEVDAELTTGEQAQILEFAKRFGLDFGELDVLRDGDDKRIYVVDVNKTPWGPPKALPPSDRRKALVRWADAFARLLD